MHSAEGLILKTCPQFGRLQEEPRRATTDSPPLSWQSWKATCSRKICCPDKQECRLLPRRPTSHVHYKKAPAAAYFPERRRRHVGAASSRRDDSRKHSICADSRCRAPAV